MDYSYKEHLHQSAPTFKRVIFVKDSTDRHTKETKWSTCWYALCFILSNLPFSSVITFPSLIIWFIFSKNGSNLTQLMSKPAGGDRGKGEAKMLHSWTVLKAGLLLYFLYAVSALYCLNTRLLDDKHLKKKTKTPFFPCYPSTYSDGRNCPLNKQLSLISLA